MFKGSVSTPLTTCQMKQVLERSLTTSVTRCVWSPKMDLLLVGNSNGEVSVQRHRSLQRVWQLPPPADHSVVAGLAWRPDSNMVAVAYESGSILLATLENGSKVHSIELSEQISSLSWHQYEKHSKSTVNTLDNFEMNLPPPDKWFSDSADSSGSQSLSSDSSTHTWSWQDHQLLLNQDNLTLLVVGTVSGKVMLYAFGMILMATIDIRKENPGVSSILDAQLSSNFYILSVMAERTRELSDDGNDKKEVCHVFCDAIILGEFHKELYALARKFAQLQCLYDYLTEALSQLREAWEGILLEMDTKLAAYPAEDERTVVALFTDLFMFGLTTPEMLAFITDKLTEKSLKKLKQNVELGYRNMQKLIVKQFEAVGKCISLATCELLGMARLTDKYGPLGVEETNVNKSYKDGGAFLVKVAELERVTETSMKQFLAFLKWLSTTNLRTSNIAVPPEQAKTTKEEDQDVLLFLQDTFEDKLTGSNGKTHRKFQLKSVGQYLEDKPLSAPQGIETNIWTRFLKNNLDLADHPILTPMRRKTSLVQELTLLEISLRKLPLCSINTISEHIHVSKPISFCPLREDSKINISQNTDSTGKMNLMLVSSTQPTNVFFCQFDSKLKSVVNRKSNTKLSETVRTGLFKFSPTDRLRFNETTAASPETSVIGAQFYTSMNASVLLRDFSDPSFSIYVLIGIQNFIPHIKNVRVPDHSSVVDCGLKCVDVSAKICGARRLNMSAGVFGVSGERKVAVILASHGKTVVLCEMEVDEDDEDDEDIEEDITC